MSLMQIQQGGIIMSVENKLRILVVEDDPDNITSARRTLADHDLTIATTAGEALGLIQDAYKGESFFDVVMTDMNLPHGFDGGTVLRSFRDYFDVHATNPIMGMAIAINVLSLSPKPIFVAIVSDGNHHRELGAALLDWLTPNHLQRNFGTALGRIAMIEARNTAGADEYRPDGTPIKNWGVALKILMAGEHT